KGRNVGGIANERPVCEIRAVKRFSDRVEMAEHLLFVVVEPGTLQEGALLEMIECSFVLSDVLICLAQCEMERHESRCDGVVRFGQERLHLLQQRMSFGEFFEIGEV